jgi:hypothetical protein
LIASIRQQSGNVLLIFPFNVIMLMATIVDLLANSLSFPIDEWNHGVRVVLLFGRRFEMDRMATVQGEIGGKKMSSPNSMKQLNAFTKRPAT